MNGPDSSVSQLLNVGLKKVFQRSFCDNISWSLKVKKYRASAVWIFFALQLRTTNSLENRCLQISKKNNGSCCKYSNLYWFCWKWLDLNRFCCKKRVDHLNGVVRCLWTAGLALLQVWNTSTRAGKKVKVRARKENNNVKQTKNQVETKKSESEYGKGLALLQVWNISARAGKVKVRKENVKMKTKRLKWKQKIESENGKDWPSSR